MIIKSINPSVEDQQITVSIIQDLYVQMAGSQVFTKLDFSHAYAQLKVDEAITKFLTINTHKGLCAYLKLPYGVKSSPKILQGTPKCVCKQDDILIGGNDENENLDILEIVLERLSENNVHIKLPKCDFLKCSTVTLDLSIVLMVYNQWKVL